MKGNEKKKKASHTRAMKHTNFKTQMKLHLIVI